MERAGEQVGVVVAADQGHDCSHAMNETVPFKEVLRRIGSYSTECWVFLPEEDPWRVDSPCLVLKSDEVSPEEEDQPDAGVPEVAKQLGMMQALTVADVQDVIENCNDQLENASDEVLFEAFIYYYDNDSYIDLK
jgi:hypothetical protein